MEIPKNILALKRILTTLNCEFSEPNLFELLDDKTWFMGLYYGCLENGKLTCTVPIYREDTSDLERYASEVREIFSKFGDTIKVALYRLSDGRTIAVQSPKEYVLRRLKYEKTTHALRGEITFDRPYVIRTFIESELPDEKNQRFTIGALIKGKDKYFVRPLLIFNPKTFNLGRLVDLVNLISIHGPLVSGIVKREESGFNRIFKLIKTTNEFSYLISKNINLPLFEDHLYEGRVKFFSKTMTPRVFIDGRMIASNYPTGAHLDPDWFGREFGFFITSPEGKTLKFSPYSARQKVGNSK